MDYSMIDVLVYVLVLLLIAYVITYCINAFIPLEAKIKNLVVVVIWALTLIAVLVKFLPMLGLSL